MAVAQSRDAGTTDVMAGDFPRSATSSATNGRSRAPRRNRTVRVVEPSSPGRRHETGTWRTRNARSGATLTPDSFPLRDVCACYEGFLVATAEQRGHASKLHISRHVHIPPASVFESALITYKITWELGLQFGRSQPKTLVARLASESVFSNLSLELIRRSSTRSCYGFARPQPPAFAVAAYQVKAKLADQRQHCAGTLRELFDESFRHDHLGKMHLEAILTKLEESYGPQQC